ncbi:putative transcription factor C2H2 family [Rosa chinensis]|uniref:RING-type E3 ubiquitin transferase n=1 Tax=Rosa chinensis TaxID=74649 RepID=A0A2P6QUP8_ROSCH|nr:putative transcription factor C2H2 family [Rosa chinensis]
MLNELLMETYDNGNEEIDGATLESMETYIAMTIPASKSAIEDLKKVRLESVETARHAGLCSICLEDFKAGVEATRLPCLHFFHGDCVVRWLEINHQCPLCRFPMPHDGTSIY